MNRNRSLAPLVSLAVIAGCGATTTMALSPGAPRLAVPGWRTVELQQAPDAATDRARRLGAISNWGYWLSSADVDAIAGAPHQLMVIDSEISSNESFERQLTPDEVARMKRRPDGSTRILLAYLSIGEAERYRPYWQQRWNDAAKRPAWFGRENKRWAGNFAVQFWHPEWQQLIFGSAESYLDRIIAQGFDGVYLDRADAFFEWRKLQPTAISDMADFISRLAEHARRQQPGFLIVMQNAEELLEEPAVLSAIDAIAKEDLLYGVRRAQEANKADDVEWSMQLLRMAQNAGRKVLVVEYLRDRDKMAAAAARILEEGFVPYFAPRRLDCLNPPAVLDASGKLPGHPCR
jgi:cysteinyl-tRNA synthetase